MIVGLNTPAAAWSTGEAEPVRRRAGDRTYLVDGHPGRGVHGPADDATAVTATQLRWQSTHPDRGRRLRSPRFARRVGGQNPLRSGHAACRTVPRLLGE